MQYADIQMGAVLSPTVDIYVNLSKEFQLLAEQLDWYDITTKEKEEIFAASFDCATGLRMSKNDVTIQRQTEAKIKIDYLSVIYQTPMVPTLHITSSLGPEMFSSDAELVFRLWRELTLAWRRWLTHHGLYCGQIADQPIAMQTCNGVTRLLFTKEPLK